MELILYLPNSHTETYDIDKNNYGFTIQDNHIHLTRLVTDEDPSTTELYDFFKAHVENRAINRVDILLESNVYSLVNINTTYYGITYQYGGVQEDIHFKHKGA